MNDATYLLDESLSKLAEIHNIQRDMANTEYWEALPQNEREDRETTLRQNEQYVPNYIALGKSTVGLLKEFTAKAKGPFLAPEIVDRLAAMLNYNLNMLAGPRCADLKVQDMSKYQFNPRELLSEILQVYLNLSNEEDFVRAVASEGRSYSKQVFDRAGSIAQKFSLKSPTEIAQFHSFITRVEETRIQIEADEDLGEVPDEFLGECPSYCLHIQLTSARSTHVHSHERPRHAAIIQGYS